MTFVELRDELSKETDNLIQVGRIPRPVTDCPQQPIYSGDKTWSPPCRDEQVGTVSQQGSSEVDVNWCPHYPNDSVGHNRRRERTDEKVW